MKANEDPVVVEQELPSTMEELWSAITDPNQMRRWYFDVIPDFRPEVGFSTEFVVQSGERSFLHRWTVTEVDSPNRIRYSWTFEGYPGEGYSEFELVPRGGGTLCRLSYVTVADFPDDVPEFTRDSCLNGWTYLIHERLKDYVGRPGQV